MELSKQIELVIRLFEQFKADYSWYSKQLEAEQGKQTNIQHELEGVGATYRTPPGYRDRAKLATEYQDVLIARRFAKDKIMLYEPIASFLNSDNGRNVLNLLRQKLGETRKAEAKFEGRRYTQRETKNTAPYNKALLKDLNTLINDWKKRTE